MENFNGKVMLITGGAQGLGKAICTTLAAAGALVIIGDIQEEKAKQTAKEIIENDGDAVYMHLDVSEEDSVRNVIDTIKSKYGRLDVLINSAGIDFTKSIFDLSVSEWDSAMKVNFRGPFLTSKFALAVMAEQRSGNIINIISTASLRAWSDASVYHATKWGLRGFTQALFVEARQYNVKVTAVIAGGMKTPFLLDRFPDIDQSKLQDPQSVAMRIRSILQEDTDTAIPEIMLIPLQETSWP